MNTLPCDDFGAFLYDSTGMLRFAGADQAAALSYAQLLSIERFTLLVREPRRPNLNGNASTNRLEEAPCSTPLSRSDQALSAHSPERGMRSLRLCPHHRLRW